MNKDMQERYIDGFCTMLRSDGLKCTSIRQNILRIFFLNHYLSVEEIMQQLYEVFQMEITKPSIYSALKLLLSYKSITEHKENKKSFYELTRHNEHSHLICIVCNKYKEFNDKLLKDSVEILTFNNDFIVTEMNITIYGICDQCNIDNQ